MTDTLLIKDGGVNRGSASPHGSERPLVIRRSGSWRSNPIASEIIGDISGARIFGGSRSTYGGSERTNGRKTAS